MTQSTRVHSWHPQTRGAALCLALVVLAGCDSGPETKRVWGTVAYDGQLIDRGTIALTPSAGTSGPSCGSEIKQGTFDISAERGAIVGGEYLVSVRGVRQSSKTMTSPDHPKGTTVPILENYVPAEFNSQSKLRITVSQTDDENEQHFKLERPR